MSTVTIELEAMYGDHHVVEVRRLLFEQPGIEEVYASSSFRIVEITFDESQLAEEKIRTILKEAGYSGELSIPVEVGSDIDRDNGEKPFFRHTSAFEHTRSGLSFSQKVPFTGRPLWPCPGIGPIKTDE